MKEKKRAYLIGSIKNPLFHKEGESIFETRLSNWMPSKDSDSWLISELEVEVDIPPVEFLQAQAVQALHRVRAEDVKKGLCNLSDIDNRIASLTAIEHKGAA